MLLAINIRQTIDANLVAAIMIAVFTVGVLSLLVYFFKFSKRGEHEPETQRPKPKKGSYGYCELNDIMGYDFVQIKTPELTVSDLIESKPAEGKQVKRYSDSQAIGMTDRPVSTTGARPQGYDDEPDITSDQKKKIEEQKKKDAEATPAAPEEHKTEVTEEFITAIGAAENAEWPEINEVIKHRNAFENMLNDGKLDDMIGDDEEDYNDYDGEPSETGNNLASPPQEKDLYIENLNKMREMTEEISASFRDSISEEQERKLSEMGFE